MEDLGGGPGDEELVELLILLIEEGRKFPVEEELEGPGQTNGQ